MRTKLLFIMLGLSLSASCQAGWQYTDWGMSPRDVYWAGKGDVRPPDTIEPDDSWIGGKRLVGQHTSGPYVFDSKFHFVEDKLDQVELSLRDARRCFALEADLKKKYGLPVADPNVNHDYWRDDVANEKVTCWRSVGSNQCLITYEALITDSNRRL